MTHACELWVGDMLDRTAGVMGDVLEIGSFDVNGSIRPAFADTARFHSYIGLDMRDGPGVDIKAKGDSLPFEDGRFDVIVTCEMLEHDDRFWTTLRECWRVLRPGGHIVITTRGILFPRHDYPSDYWRFTIDGLRSVLQWAGFEYADVVEDPDDLGVFALARRVDQPEEPTPRPAPEAKALLADSEVAILRQRMRALIPLGITSVADAFERLDSDRRLLLGIVEDIWAGVGLPEVAERLRLAMENRVAIGE